MCNDLRFFTPLRYVQNDSINLQSRSRILCLSNANRTYLSQAVTCR